MEIFPINTFINLSFSEVKVTEIFKEHKINIDFGIFPVSLFQFLLSDLNEILNFVKRIRTCQ